MPPDPSIAKERSGFSQKILKSIFAFLFIFIGIWVWSHSQSLNKPASAEPTFGFNKIDKTPPTFIYQDFAINQNFIRHLDDPSIPRPYTPEGSLSALESWLHMKPDLFMLTFYLPHYKIFSEVFFSGPLQVSYSKFLRLHGFLFIALGLTFLCTSPSIFFHAWIAILLGSYNTFIILNVGQTSLIGASCAAITLLLLRSPLRYSSLNTFLLAFIPCLTAIKPTYLILTLAFLIFHNRYRELLLSLFFLGTEALWIAGSFPTLLQWAQDFIHTAGHYYQGGIALTGAFIPPPLASTSFVSLMPKPSWIPLIYQISSVLLILSFVFLFLKKWRALHPFSATDTCRFTLYALLLFSPYFLRCEDALLVLLPFLITRPLTLSQKTLALLITFFIFNYSLQSLLPFAWPTVFILKLVLFAILESPLTTEIHLSRE